MKNIRFVIILVLIVIIGIWLFLKYLTNQRKKKELEEKAAKLREEIRQKLFEFYKSKLNDIKIAAIKFAKHLEAQAGYFTNYQLITWKNDQTNLYKEIKGKSYETIQLSSDEVKLIQNFSDYFINGNRFRDDYNKKFVSEEVKRYSSLFDNIEGRKLDEQQRVAVVTDEDNNIIIAGAGSGKTTTIVGKVNYVIDRYKVAPEEILLISFTNKSALTLANRINIEGVEAKTFHKFGKDTIAEIERKQPSIFDDNQFKPLLTRFFSEQIKNDNYLKILIDYFSNYLKPFKSQFEFKNQGEYIQYIKDQNFRTYKLIEVPTRGKTTYKMEVVKSIEECKIANFLFFNGLEYKYEFPYEFDTANETYRQYKPDFTIEQNGRKLYLEHFAVARNGDIPGFFTKDEEAPEVARNRYWEKIHWARDLHKSHNTTLIETYSYEMSEGILSDNLAKHLIEAGIALRPKSPEEIWQIIQKAAKEEVNSFVLLIGTFITLMKSNNYSITDIIIKNRETKDDFLRHRNELFIQIIKPIYEQHGKHLLERGEIDFSDMINKATEFIKSGKLGKKISYIIIDEFQDISIGRYQLIKALKEINPACKLFAVGDDWQSIYRFSGSDIALFKDFEKYFGFTAKSKIETTYRFGSPLIGFSSEFILKNPNQAYKELGSAQQAKRTEYKIFYSVSDNQDDSATVQTIFDQLLTRNENIHQKDIFVLGRYGFDIQRLKNENGAFRIDKENETISYSVKADNGDVKKLTARFMTVHKSKGLEADIIIILNCNSGKHGFPSEMSDDVILNLLLSEADQFVNGEERRLFYVAMTRAKELVCFVADAAYKSKFISEIEVDNGLSSDNKCPNCKTADVVLRKTGTAKNGNSYKFYGCSNFLYGCDYTTTEWINRY